MNKLETLSETEAVIGNTDRIDLIIVRLPFVKPFATSTYTWNVKEALLVKISAGDCTGWGECVADPDPFYSPETTVSARHIIKDFLIPGIEGGVTLAEVEKRFQQVRGNSMAKSCRGERAHRSAGQTEQCPFTPVPWFPGPENHVRCKYRTTEQYRRADRCSGRCPGKKISPH